MSYTIHAAAIPVLRRQLTNLAAILQKGAAFAEARKIDPSVLLNARLAPDMFALTRQVQIATDVAKGAGARLSQADVPSYADDETSFDQLQARLQKTLAFLDALPVEAFDGAEARTVTLKVGGNEMQFSGADYLAQFVLPNLFFHTAMSYAILRHNGVELGKMDYLGKPD